MWDLVPWLEIEPGAPALGAQSHWMAREVPCNWFFAYWIFLSCNFIDLLVLMTFVVVVLAIKDHVICKQRQIFFFLYYLLLLFSRSVTSNSLWPHGLQHAKLPCPSLSPGVCSNACPLCRWCRPTISSSVIPFSSCLQSFLASGSFPMSQFFTSGGQSIGLSASASVFPMNIQGWFPLGLIYLNSLQSKGSQEFSPTPQFESINSLVLSLFCGPNLTFLHDYWKNHSFDYKDLCWQSDASVF